MGRNWAALVVLSFFLGLSGHGMEEDSLNESPVVREVIAQPLRIRILLEQRNSSRPLVLRGSALNVNGKLQQGSELNCHYQTEWVCSVGTGKSSKSFRGKLVIRSGDAFLRIDKAFYRDTIILVAHGSKLSIVNQLPLEDYLVGVVNSEISSKYPREAIKAQVIAARSYALACVHERQARGGDYDLDSTEIDQAYKGAQVEDPLSHFAVLETKGKVLEGGLGRIVKAFYHASSGGSLEMPEAVWGKARDNNDTVYSLNSPVEAHDDTYHWKISFGPWIGLKIPGLGMLRDIQVLERSAGERVRKVLLVGETTTKIIQGSELRKLFGGRWLKSTLFNIEPSGTRWILEGRGFGHGVGMSQEGAKTLAGLGWSYQRILAAYYPGAHVDTLIE